MEDLIDGLEDGLGFIWGCEEVIEGENVFVVGGVGVRVDYVLHILNE
jgi:hypothetical protein